MKRFHLPAFLAFIIALLFVPARAQQVPPAAKVAPMAAGNNAAGVDVERIVRAFTAKETEFRQALNQYSFKRDAVIQTLGMGGQISGEYHRVSRFIFAE
ncbi:MAG: hypothetical protein H0T45_11785, partial [Pyrinomonadaceae bacterium]|nr:hypothetical protein [Pyrinomonadaceae bacterium]